MPPTSQPYVTKRDWPLKELANKRVGIEGNWFVRVVRSHLKREDPYWALNGPISPAFEAITNKFLNKLDQFSITPVFVFDGLYTRRQAHPAVLLHGLSSKTEDVRHQVRELEPLDEDAIAYLLRMLVSLNVEVVTAPYLAWVQLTYFSAMPANKPFIDEIFGTHDVLTVPVPARGPRRVITEIGNLNEPNTALTVVTAENPEEVLQHIIQPPRLHSSPHWSWLQHNNPTEDFQHVKSTINYCPVLTLDGQVTPISKVFNQPAIAMLRPYFYNDLGAEFPLVYFLLSCNVVSPQLLSVAAAEQFIDDPPLLKSRQYDETLERIIPLRTQIVFQLIQELERYLKGFERMRGLKWERPHEERAGHQSLPIQRPPKIALDEWDAIEPNPAHPYDFISVLQYHQQAKAVDENAPERDRLRYATSEQALGAVLLKALDLLGYFTHAAHTSSDDEESSMSIFAQALQASKFGNEGVLLIELTRTRSLHDGPLDIDISAEHTPNKNVPPGLRYAARVMSLLHVDTKGLPDKDQVAPWSADLLAFNDIARAFQRNLRLLCEAVAASQVLNHSAQYPLKEMRDFAARLPFARPLTTCAGVILEFMLTTPEYRKLPAMRKIRVDYLQNAFPNVANMDQTIDLMCRFWKSCTSVVCKLLEDEEAEPDFFEINYVRLRQAQDLVVEAFRGITQLAAIPEMQPPQPPL